jgi:hypothetical protein
MKKYLTLAAAAAALSTSSAPVFAAWTVQQSGADPVAPNGTSMLIATELGERSGLSIRCLEGKIFLLLVVQASSGALRGDPASVKLIADAKDGHAFFRSRHGGGVHMRYWGERVCST